MSYKLKSVFVQEQLRYTQNKLCEICECTEDMITPVVRKLKEYGILKVVKASEEQKNMAELNDDDVQASDVFPDENGCFYVFAFVGVITCYGFIFKCYPKYIVEKDPEKELKQVLKVLEKYDSDNEPIRMFNEICDSKAFNLLSVLLFLLQDYYENGVYSNSEEIVECNGSGEILWDRTINETFMLIGNDRPYYVDMLTRRHVDDEYSFFKRLHECVLSIASAELGEAGLLNLFDITDVVLSDESLDDFGEKDYLLYRINRELDIQFNTRKQLVLKALYAYIDRGGHLNDAECLSMFGTNSFNVVWERICKQILDDQLENSIGSIKLPKTLEQERNEKTRLIDFIERPLWTITERRAEDTLIPDIITIYKKRFLIFDAKYYRPSLEIRQTPRRQPGIESVTKQYCYQLAYKKFIKEHGFESVRNCFLIPSEEDEVIDKGNVRMDMFRELGLEDILVRFVPTKEVYSHYLTDSKMDISCLKLESTVDEN